MQNSPDFFTTRAKNCRIKLEKIKQELPFYCTEYFTSIENITTPLARLNYGYDLRIFFDFLVKRYFTNKKAIDVSLKDLESLSAADIEAYLSYLSYYTFNDKELMCAEAGKSRKLSSVRSFFKYLFSRDYLTSDVASKVKVPKIRDKEIIRLDVNENVNEIADLIETVDSGDG